MKAYVGVTDRDWLAFLSGLEGVDEVNFWQPRPWGDLEAAAREKLTVNAGNYPAGESKPDRRGE